MIEVSQKTKNNYTILWNLTSTEETKMFKISKEEIFIIARLLKMGKFAELDEKKHVRIQDLKKCSPTDVQYFFSSSDSDSDSDSSASTTSQKCTAIKADGKSPCTRDAKLNGLCTQHFKIMTS